jgi:hypothetical protein
MAKTTTYLIEPYIASCLARSRTMMDVRLSLQPGRAVRCQSVGQSPAYSALAPRAARAASIATRAKNKRQHVVFGEMIVPRLHLLVARPTEALHIGL